MANKWMGAVAELKDIDCQKILAGLNWAEMVIARNNETDGWGEALDTLKVVEKSIIKYLAVSKEHVDPISLAHFFSASHKSCLGMLMTAYAISGNEAKAREYCTKYSDWCIRTDVYGREDAQAASDLINARFNTKPGKKEDNSIQLLKDMYESAAERGKDSADAIKMAACVADAYIEQNKMEESVSIVV